MDESLPSSVNLAEYLTVCTCGRSFTHLNAYGNHQWMCKKRKKHLSNALAKAKEAWIARKRLHREEGDKLAGFIPPPAFGPHACAQTLEAGESGLRPQLSPEFADSEFCPEQTTTNEVECSANTGSESDLLWAIIHVEGNGQGSPSESSCAADNTRSLAERCPRCLNCRLPAWF
ncbi:hypothetical protein AZE42_08300 [Rhizopogon vesiculosus]|uniref:Uncharacterized protein n=1 Tax=Rhizopogon vesiculosus TaxID=180088 RepID=A0A1J8QWP3_9AGAM|nr:hypothetical protein AZE42_08300 [Rhizopogon vesiculosus]